MGSEDVFTDNEFRELDSVMSVTTRICVQSETSSNDDSEIFLRPS